MKVIIVAPKNVYQIKELSEELENRGHSVHTVDLSFITIGEIDDLIENFFNDSDLVYFRTGPDNIIKKYLVEKLLQKRIKVINASSYNNPLFTDKLNQMVVASQKDIAIPKTIFFELKDMLKTQGHRIDQIYSSITRRLGSTFIVKQRNGSKGEGIYKIHSVKQFLELIDTHAQLTEDLILQEFIQNNGDFRVIATREKVIGMFKRVPKGDEFRANFSLGGTAEIVPESAVREHLRKTSLDIMGKLDLDVVGIDLVLSEQDGKLYFFEVNRSMQWRGFREATNINVAEHIVDYFESISY